MIFPDLSAPSLSTTCAADCLRNGFARVSLPTVSVLNKAVAGSPQPIQQIPNSSLPELTAETRSTSETDTLLWKKAMARDPRTINTVGNVSGSNISINQIYAPAAMSLQPRSFNTIADARPFSIDWLIFSQRSVPFFGRKAAVEAITAFLHAPDPFRWWAIVGEGGSGKSRLALEMLDCLPDGWAGGFMRKENVTLRDAAAWRPEAHHFWVVDYAASHYDSLRDIITAWEQLFRTSSFKVRLLLLERGYSEASGWWSELTSAMSSNRASAVNTLYRPPLALPPLVGQSRAFLDGVGARLNADMRERLLRGLSAIADDRLDAMSQDGNPLLLLLLAADILAQGEDSRNDDSLDVDTIVERHLGRELDLIRTVCEGAGLDYQSMLCVLFATTSMYPFVIPEDHDILLLKTEDNKVLSRLNGDGKYVFPTFSEARTISSGIGTFVDERLRVQRESLARITGVQDIDHYLDVLAEAGYGRASHSSLQPDRLGETLIRLLLNAASVRKSLKRRRGEIDRLRLTQLIVGCLGMSMDACATNWARLDDDALLSLADYVRQGGKSIRLVLIVLRLVNMRRNAKAPFDPQRVFAPNRVHTDAPRVGLYFTKILGVLSQSRMDSDSPKRLAHEPDAWVLPYVDFLQNLLPRQRTLLGLIICRINDRKILSRLSNLENFLSIISSSLSTAIEGDDTNRSKEETRAYAELVDAAIAFCRDQAYPILEASQERDVRGPCASLVWIMIDCSYCVMNSRLERKETKKSRQRALRGLSVARKTLKLSMNHHQLAYVDRNAAYLKVADIDDQSAAIAVHVDALAAMREYADAKDFTATVLDALGYLAVRGGGEAVVIAAHRFLADAPVRLLIGNEILTSVVGALGDIVHVGSYERIGDALFPLVTVLLETMRTSASQDDLDRLEILLSVAVDAAMGSPTWAKRLNDMLATVRTWMERGDCSFGFMKAVFIAIANYSMQLKAEAVAALPFQICVVEIDRTVVASLLGGDIAPEILQEVEVFRLAHVEFLPSGGIPIRVDTIGLTLKNKDVFEAHRDDFARLRHRLSRAADHDLLLPTI